jgi:UDP-N-acetyl-D-mannosaminouronate:lipid I N-acetyl-D-mannosaminouronosyltransferase
MNNEVTVGDISVSSFKSIEHLINSAILDGNSIKPGIGIAINPEKIMTAKNDISVKAILDKATLKYPDGIGVTYVMSKKLGEKVARIPGCELWENLMISSIPHKIPVFILGATGQVIHQTRDKLVALGVNVVGFHDGYFDKNNPEDIINEIKNSGAKIISVGLGSPSQELFIFDCVKDVPNAFYMGVGGTYDVYTGSVKRAPWFFRKIHCEWLFRLLSNPTRMKRQFNLVKYIQLYLTGKL